MWQKKVGEGEGVGEGKRKAGHVAVFQRRHKKFIKINCKVNKQVAEAFVAAYAC